MTGAAGFWSDSVGRSFEEDIRALRTLARLTPDLIRVEGDAPVELPEHVRNFLRTAGEAELQMLLIETMLAVQRSTPQRFRNPAPPPRSIAGRFS